MIYQQAPSSQSQALRFGLIQATWVSESYAVQTLYILIFFFTPKGGLVFSFHWPRDFPVCHTRVPAPTISSHGTPSQPASSSQVPCVCCPALLLSRGFFTPPPVGGTSLPSTSSQCFSLPLCPIAVSFLYLLFFLLFSFFIFLWLSLVHLLRTNMCWAAHPNTICMKWNMIIFQQSDKAVVDQTVCRGDRVTCSAIR